MCFDEGLEGVEGTIAYGADGDAATHFTLQSATGANLKMLSDFKPLDSADRCTFMFDAGTFKQKLPESWLDNNAWYLSWTENADGTYSLNRVNWGDDDVAERIPAEDLALYKAWMAKYPSTDASSAFYKPYPGTERQHRHFRQHFFEQHPCGQHRKQHLRHQGIVRIRHGKARPRQADCRPEEGG